MQSLGSSSAGQFGNEEASTAFSRLKVLRFGVALGANRKKMENRAQVL